MFAIGSDGLYFSGTLEIEKSESFRRTIGQQNVKSYLAFPFSKYLKASEKLKYLSFGSKTPNQRQFSKTSEKCF